MTGILTLRRALTDIRLTDSDYASEVYHSLCVIKDQKNEF